jgi:DNA replication licensing factor MCM5
MGDSSINPTSYRYIPPAQLTALAYGYGVLEAFIMLLSVVILTSCCGLSVPNVAWMVAVVSSSTFFATEIWSGRDRRSSFLPSCCKWRATRRPSQGAATEKFGGSCMWMLYHRWPNHNNKAAPLDDNERTAVPVAMDFDETRIYYSHQQLHRRVGDTAAGGGNDRREEDNVDNDNDETTGATDDLPTDAIRRHFVQFLRNYKINNDNRFVYRDRLLYMYRKRHDHVTVDVSHVGDYDPGLCGYLLHQPMATLPLLEMAAAQALQSFLYDMTSTTTSTSANSNSSSSSSSTIQVLLSGNLKLTALRSIQSSHMNKLLQCPAIVVSTPPVRHRPIQLKIRCNKCFHEMVLHPTSDNNNTPFPLRCIQNPTECPKLPYSAVPDESIFCDEQKLKIQEAPERVPTGEMPRSVQLLVEKALVDTAPPGTRGHFLCVPLIGGGGANNNQQVYLKCVGLVRDNDSHGRRVHFTAAEEAAFVRLSKLSNVYDVLCHSIAPTIQGSYTMDIKKALACQLLGGSRKCLPDGVKLRGDINVLLLGDPSMAKSQFLKYIASVAPVGIYTSGKGSSAAGLTASVIRSANGEFHLEGGAMVLADGGIVCIDEFDKMRPNDRVAIHEAMEQQTISVAKAGITTVLNSRASVLAAANPVYGTYDDNKSQSDNIDLMTTILSRFDMIFLVRDVREEERDRLICQHVMGVHMTMAAANAVQDVVVGGGGPRGGAAGASAMTGSNGAGGGRPRPDQR